MSGADDFGAGRAQALQRVKADSISGEQVGEIQADRAGGAGTRAAQFMHLRGVQTPGEVNRASVSELLDLNAAFHARVRSKVDTIASCAGPGRLSCFDSPRLVTPRSVNHNIR